MNRKKEFFYHLDRIALSDNWKLTTKRRLIIEILFESKKPLRAKEILNLFYNKTKQKIDLSTIYAVLNILKDLQMLDILYIEETKQRFYSLKYFSSQTYMVCLKCGKIIVFDDIKLNNMIQNLCYKNEFLMLDKTVILFGKCEDCE